jgi:hypothetical protein
MATALQHHAYSASSQLAVLRDVTRGAALSGERRSGPERRTSTFVGGDRRVNVDPLRSGMLMSRTTGPFFLLQARQRLVPDAVSPCP